MRKRIGRPSPAMVVAMTALVVALAGSAYAAVKIGGKNIKPNAIKTSKIKNGAVTGPKLAAGAVSAANLAPGAIPANSLADGSVTTAKIGDGAVTTAKIGDGAVTAAKLDPNERADAFTSSHGQVSLPTAVETTAMQTALPVPGNYVLTVSGEIGNASGAANFIACSLLDANDPLASSGSATTNSNTFQDSISLTGISDGGTVRLRCTPDANAQIRNLELNAIRVNTVTQLTSTP